MSINDLAAFFSLIKYSDDTFELECPSADEAYAHADNFIRAMKDVMSRLDDSMDETELMTQFYDVGKQYYSKDTLREYFKDIYYVLHGSPDGVRIGNFVHIFGVEHFRNVMMERITSPLHHLPYGNPRMNRDRPSQQ